MVHVETGMAYALNKPVVLFVKEGTNVAPFLPNITQYIILNEQKNDLIDKYTLIYTLLNNAFNLIKNVRDKKATKGLTHVLIIGLAIWGAYKLAEMVFKALQRPAKRTPNKKVERRI
jgi:nucleoside 2-deoxyribosyltransferase